MRKSVNYRDSWNNNNFRKRETSKKKQKTDTKKDARRIRSDNFTRGNREKSRIAIVILKKKND